MLESLLETLHTLLREDFWILEVLLAVLLAPLVHFFLNRFLNRLKTQLTKTKNTWDDAVLEAVRYPAVLSVWLVGLTFAAQIVVSEIHTDTERLQSSTSIRSIGIVIIISWFLVRLIRNLEQRYIARNRQMQSGQTMDRATIEAMAKLLRMAVIIVAGVVVLQTLGISVSGVLAFGGIGGIVVGFAAKGVLSNFFGGLMLHLDRPFSIGDWIRSPDREIEGIVESIGWRLTSIRTFDLRPIYIPNSLFTNIVVENASRMQHRRIYETIGIRYNDITQMDAIVAEVQKMLTQHPGINQQQTLMVNFNAIASSSVDFFVYAFTHTTSWNKFHNIKQSVLLEIATIIEQNRAEIAYPTSTLHLLNRQISAQDRKSAPMVSPR